MPFISSARPVSRISRRARTTPSPSAMLSSASSRSRRRARAPTRASSAIRTTRSNGTSSSRCRTCIYTDGNAFSLWRDGEIVGEGRAPRRRHRDAGSEAGGAAHAACRSSPISCAGRRSRRSNAKQLAEISARLCRLLRDEVIEQMELGNQGLTALAQDWRKLLFPRGERRAVRRRLRAGRHLRPAGGPRARHLARRRASRRRAGAAQDQLADRHGAATADRRRREPGGAEDSLGTLTRVLDAVDWQTISKDKPEAWLYFYEDFLRGLRQHAAQAHRLLLHAAGSGRARWCGSWTRRCADRCFERAAGLAAPDVTLADPAVGTGTFLLGVLRRIAADGRGRPGRGRGARRDRGGSEARDRLRDAVRPVRGRAASPHRRDAGADGDAASRSRRSRRSLSSPTRSAIRSSRKRRSARSTSRSRSRGARPTRSSARSRSRSYRQSALQGEGGGARRLDRERQRRPAVRRWTAGCRRRMGRRRARAST